MGGSEAAINALHSITTKSTEKEIHDIVNGLTDHILYLETKNRSLRMKGEYIHESLKTLIQDTADEDDNQ